MKKLLMIAALAIAAATLSGCAGFGDWCNDCSDCSVR